jgi:hypothetical protein
MRRVSSEQIRWLLFLASSGTSLSVSTLGWAEAWYFHVLFALLLLSVVIATWILATARSLPLTGVAIGIGFVLGQWWFLEWLLMGVYWSAKGFAP